MAERASGYKLVFEFPRMMTDFAIGYLDEPWMPGLDWSTLELVPGDFVTGDLQERTNDLLWRVRWTGEDRWLYIYLLVEFQGAVQWHMAVRMATYEILLYEQLIRSERVKNGEMLPPIFGIVLYTGEGRWTAARNLADLVERLPGAEESDHPRLGYRVLEEKELAKRGLGGVRNLASALFRMKHAKTVEEMLAILGEVAEWLKAPEQTGLRLALVEWIRRVLLPLRAPHATLPAMVDLMEAKRVMAEQTIDWGRPWKEEGKKEGLRTGVQKGEATLLIRQMRTKFGPVPRTVQQKIASADARTLLKWGDRVLSATRLEEVFE